ncbi:MAG: preprotein translocase subunit SecE [Pirellulales bacterium]
MSSEKTAVASSVVSELLQTGVYKRSQGKITRQATFGAMAATVAIGAWRLNGFLEGAEWFSGARFVVPGAILALGLWVAYRVVNYPRFADFLIAVEAEMNKVSWPSRGELYRSSFVVIFVLFSLSAVLFGFDVVWRVVFQLIGVVQ